MSLRLGIDGRNLIHRRTGIGRYIHHMASALAKLGHELHIYLPKPAHSDFSHIKGATYHISHYNKPLTSLIWGEFILPKFVRKTAIDLFWGPAHRLPSRRLSSLPHLLTIHDLVWLKAPETMQRRGLLGEKLLMTKSIMAADNIITVSDATGHDIGHHFPRCTASIQTIYPGATNFAPLPGKAEDKLYQNSKPYSLFVGTIEPRKNLIRLLQAYGQLDHDTQAQADLVIAGGKGWGGIDLDLEIAKLNIQDYVHVLPHVSDTQLGDLYAHCLFLSMPSLYEGFGLPLVEAMIHGKPVLTSNISSMPEVAGEAGHLIDPQNIQSIRAGLKKLIHDTAYRTQLSEKAKATAQQFDWDHSAAQLSALCTNMILDKKG